MRRLFIIRKDLHLSAGKLAAMVGHCCEAYWTNLLKDSFRQCGNQQRLSSESAEIRISIPAEIWNDYVNGIFTKTICEARNRNGLMKAADKARELGLVEGTDWGLINDKCLTELTAENDDGTTTVGIWFRPLPDDAAHSISRKYPLYRDHGEESK